MVYPSMVKSKDPVTNNIVLQILTDGIEYEDDLQAVIEDVGLLQSK
jgi:bacterioferritin